MAEPRRVVVEETGSGFLQRIQAGRHAFLADEPESAGGEDRGPDPYALLLAALGACTSMTLRMYASRKRWPVERITVSLEHGRDHARDCAETESPGSRIEHITREISLTGTISEAQKQRLLEIAERCPLHRTLTASKHVVTRLAGE